MQVDEQLLAPLTKWIIVYALKVANALRHGLVEKVCENALAHEMRKCELSVVQQRGTVVFYDDVINGEYTADPLVKDPVVVEPIVVAECISHNAVPICRDGQALCCESTSAAPKEKCAA